MNTVECSLILAHARYDVDRLVEDLEGLSRAARLRLLRLTWSQTRLRIRLRNAFRCQGGDVGLRLVLPALKRVELSTDATNPVERIVLDEVCVDWRRRRLVAVTW
jgi:hypothetical protein